MRKLLCIILTFIMCSICVISYSDNLTDLQSQADELQDQIDDATGDLGDVEEELSANLQQVQKLDETITKNQTELDELNTKIAELQENLTKTQEELTDVEKRYNEQKALLDERLVAIYEAGNIQYLDVVLSSASIGEFISNYFLITELASYDNDLLEVVERQKKTIETSKASLENTRKEMVTAQQNQAKTAKVLENSKTVRQHYVSQLSEEEKNIQAQIDEYNAQFAAIEAEIKFLAENKISDQYIGGVMAWPIPGYTKITSKFGMRTHPITGVYKLHTGVDVSAPIGANFIAAADGVVTKAAYNGAYGNMVIIDHGGGISTLYAHGSQIMVQQGQAVKKNDIVLKVGSTGYSTGPHAHFEVRVNGSPVQPLDYITSQSGTTDGTVLTTNATN